MSKKEETSEKNQEEVMDLSSIAQEDVLHPEEISTVCDEAEISESSEISKMQERILELEDQLKRQAADFDNFRKRSLEEREKIKQLAQENIVLDFLPIFDNIERALDSIQEDKVSIESIKTGLDGIIALFQSFLEKQEIQKMESIGSVFDPKIHEALFMQEGDYTQKEVIQEVEKAYVRKDKVIRTAKVGVGIPKN